MQTALPKPKPARLFPPPSMANKIARLVWRFVQGSVYRYSPTFLFGWRRAILRLFGGRISAGALPYPGVNIWAPWNLVMHSNSCLGNGVHCYNVAEVTIEADAVVSFEAHLCTPSHDFRRDDFALIASEIIIRQNAWVATQAFVGPGVTIGRNAVVGARAVVSRNVPDDMVVAGNPARIVGHRSIVANEKR